MSRRAGWIVAPSGSIAAWLHCPEALSVRGGVVLVPPFGHEYVHSHRTLLHLADRFAERGLLAMRLDLHGTGSSDGDAFSPGLMDKWVKDVRAAMALLTSATGTPTSIFALRLGAPIASAATGEVEAEHLVLWEPVLKGRRFVREARALSGLATDPSTTSKPYVEAAGFPIADETAEEIQRLDMLARGPRVTGEALIVGRDDLKPDDRLPAALRNSGIETEVAHHPGFVEMLAEPHDTVVPEATVAFIAEWLGERTRHPEVAIDPSVLLRQTARRLPDDTVEELVRLPGEEGLFGVLTTPRGDGNVPLLLLSNAGSVHHVGPNRLYVELARRLAEQGYASFRLDLRNLGDSLRPGADDENHPYPDSAGADMELVIDWLSRERGFDRIVVAGLCSGAHTAFHTVTGTDSDSVIGALLINPLTFNWRPGMSLAIPSAYQAFRDWSHYRESLRSVGSWGRLLKGRANLRYIATFMLRWVRAGLVGPTTDLLEAARLRKPSPLANELMAIGRGGRTIDLLFSRSDPGYHILRSGARHASRQLAKRGVLSISFVENADHTFTNSERRAEAIDEVLRILAARLGS